MFRLARPPLPARRSLHVSALTRFPRRPGRTLEDPPTPPPRPPNSGTTWVKHKPLSTGETPDLTRLDAPARLVYNHLVHAFLPFNQASASPAPDLPPTLLKRIAESGAKVISVSNGPRRDARPDLVGMLVSPVEGGEAYIQDAVIQATAAMGADLKIVDASMALLDLDPSNSPHAYSTTEEQSEETGMALNVRMPQGLIPPGLRMLAGDSGWQMREEHVERLEHFFNDLPPKSVVLIEATSSMSQTFEAWWPAAMEAMRRKRRTHPVTVLLSFAPGFMPGAEGVWAAGEAEGRAAREAARTKILTKDPHSIVPFEQAVTSDVLVINPVERHAKVEKAERAKRRRHVFISQINEIMAGTSGLKPDTASRPWTLQTIPYTHARRVVQHALSKGSLTWDSLTEAWHECELPAPKVDLVDRVKRDLTKQERKLEGCVVDPSTLNETFADVHLPETTTDAIRSMVSLPLLFPDAFSTGILRKHSTNGALLFGPPGTGKTLVARAVARECGAQMLAVKASDINDKWLGESEKNVKAVFSLARKLAPCVLFLDEVDAMLSARVDGGLGGGASAHNTVLNEFMQEMDGIVAAEGRVVVIGATNRPFDLDDAILRRLPRRLLVDLPDASGREAILRILLRDEHLDADVNLEKLAQETDGFSGSDLKHLCISAALAAVKESITVPWRQTSSATPASAPLTTRAKRPDTPRIRQPLVHALHTDAAPSTSTSTPAPTRTLKRKHFDLALKEIRPSATDEGTLPALRKWAEQFGEGSKGKRKGFGKGFGFADPLDKKKRDAALGRVRED